MNQNNLAQKSNYTAGSHALQIGMLYLTSVNIPGISFNHPELSTRSGSKLNLGGDTLSYNSLALEVLLDEQFLVYEELTKKIFDSVNPVSGAFAMPDFDFWVQINNSKGNYTMKIDFTNCRIESIGDITFEPSSDETEFTLSIELKYDYYKVTRTQIVPTLQVK